MKIRQIARLCRVCCACCAALALTTSCADDNQEARTPVAQVRVDKQQLEVNESMTLHFTGVADQVVVYTGDKDHQYALRDSSNTGFVVNKDLLTYSYSVPGRFHVVCVASTYDTYMGGSLRQDSMSFDVEVTDQVTTIDAIYTTVTPNVYMARQQGDDWLLCLPTKQLYNNREMNVNAARQRLTIEVGSDSAKVFIDGEPYVARNYYALNTDHQIRVVSGSGMQHDYRLCGMIYPEFKTITVDGAAPKLTRSAYYQDLLTYAVGDGTRLEFTLDDDVRLLADGREVSSGSTLQRDAQYTLVRSHAANPQLQAVTRVEFNNVQ